MRLAYVQGVWVRVRYGTCNWGPGHSIRGVLIPREVTPHPEKKKGPRKAWSLRGHGLAVFSGAAAQLPQSRTV